MLPYALNRHKSMWQLPDTSRLYFIPVYFLLRYLAALNVAYGQAYGDTLQRAVEKEVSDSVISRGMSAMLLDRADYYASELNWAVAGAGTDKDTLTRVVSKIWYCVGRD